MAALGEGQIEELERLTETDQRRAVEVGQSMFLTANGFGERSRIARLIGNAYRRLARLDLAIEQYALSLELASKTSDPNLVAEVLMSRAGAHAFSGAYALAISDLDQALEMASGSLLPRLLFQRAAVIQRFDEGPMAVRAYDEAIPLLQHDSLFLANALSNRALAHAYQGEVDLAQTDLEEALQLYQAEGMHSAAVDVIHNLGFVAGRRGDIHSALRYLDEAEEEFGRLNRPLAELHLDRAEILLMAGLTSDAYALAAATAVSLASLGMHASAAESVLLAAHAAAAEGDHGVAMRHAVDARNMFGGQGRSGWEAHAQLVYLESLIECEAASDDTLEEVLGLAVQLGAIGHRDLLMRAAACGARMAIALGRIDVAAKCAVQAKTASANASAFSRAIELTVRAEVAAARGDRRSALRAARSCLRIVRQEREVLAATDLRTMIGLHSERANRLGLELIVRSGQARRVLGWTELMRSSRLPASWSGSTNSEITTHLARLRSISAALTSPEAERRPSLLRERASLETRLRRLRHKESAHSETATPIAINVLLARLEDRVLLSYFEADEVLWAVVLNGRRAVLRRLGDVTEVSRAKRALGATTRRVLLGGSERPFWLAAKALEASVIPSGIDGTGTVIVVPSRSVASIPWGALPRLRDRSLVVTPSATWWANVSPQAKPRHGEPLVLNGPGLRFGRAEARAVAAVAGAAEALDARSSKVSLVLDRLSRASLAHMVCHGDIRPESPMFSALRLSDGPLTMHDLEALDSVPEVIVLSACSAGAAASFASDGMLSIASALLSAGARSVVAATSEVADSTASRHFMVAFHRCLKSGSSPSRALAEARLEVADVNSTLYQVFGAD